MSRGAPRYLYAIALHEAGDQRSDLEDMLADLRHVVGRTDVQGAHVVEERIDVVLRIRERLLPGLLRPADDHFLDVREVHDVGDVVSQEFEIPPGRIETYFVRRDLSSSAGPIDQRKIAAFARRKPWVQIPLGPLHPRQLGRGTTGTGAPDLGPMRFLARSRRS